MFNAAIPTPWYKPYSTIASPIVATTDDPKASGRNACGFTVGISGTVVIRPPHAPAGGGGDLTLNVIAGKDYWYEFKQITSGTALDVIVIWPRG